jgi:hypothetical protein
MDTSLRLRQAPGLEISEAVDGVLAYQRDRDRVHFLNPTAALVLESCDGTLAVGELPALIAAAFDLPVPPVADVDGCVASLLQEGLLIVPESPAAR